MLKELFLSARKICYQKKYTKPEMVLAVFEYYSRSRQYFDSVLDHELRSSLDEMARETKFGASSLQRTFTDVNGKIPYFTFDKEAWVWSRTLSSALFQSRATSRAMLACNLGMAQRSASEIIESNQYIIDKPSTWVGYLWEYCSSIDKQVELEASLLEDYFLQRKLENPLDLFDSYLQRRLGVKMNSYCPGTRTLGEAWQALKAEVAEFERKEVLLARAVSDARIPS